MVTACQMLLFSQLRFKKDDDDMLYTTMYVRRQVIWAFLVNFEIFREEIMEDIRMERGRIDSEKGPFNVKQWYQYTLIDKKYYDSIFVKLLASMWGMRITLIRSDNCQQLKFRHDLGWKMQIWYCSLTQYL